MQLDRVEWGSDLPSVESHLENHKNVHRAIEEFESSLKEAKISEVWHRIPHFLSCFHYRVVFGFYLFLLLISR